MSFEMDNFLLEKAFHASDMTTQLKINIAHLNYTEKCHMPHKKIFFRHAMTKPEGFFL